MLYYQSVNRLKGTLVVKRVDVFGNFWGRLWDVLMTAMGRQGDVYGKC